MKKCDGILFQTLKLLILLITIVCSGGCSSQQVKAVRSGPIIKESSNSFVDFAELAVKEPGTQLESLFRTTVYITDPDYYESRLGDLGRMPGGVSSQLKLQIDDFSKNRSRYISVQTRLNKDIQPALESFLGVFPDFDSSNTISIIHSLGQLNGGTREVLGKSRFFLGVDVIAKFHSWSNQVPFFHHELFHLYHQQKNPLLFSKSSIGISLWKEGLATYMSEYLNKGATPEEMMLEVPMDLFLRCQKTSKRLARTIHPLVRKESEDDYKMFFLMSGGNDEIPKRAGYCLGYLLVTDIAHRFSISELVSLSENDVYREIEKSLLKLEAN